jgi:hypothetical protein
MGNVNQKLTVLAANFVLVICGLPVTGCGGGGSDDEPTVTQGPPLHWIKICNPGMLFCTLTTGECSAGDTKCTVCDLSKPLGQC